MKHIPILIFASAVCFMENNADSIEESVEGHHLERVATAEKSKSLKSKTPRVLDFIELVERWGRYTAEEYTVVSDDGYILKLHRISGSPFKPKTDGKPVIYIQHCLFCSSDTFIEYGPQQSLALQLADNGYDVWIGNIRGNTYSRAHTIYSPDQNAKQFWKFSLDEPALLDIPKFIDFTLEKTKQKKLTYIGYSMGTTLGYILLTGKPKYNKKINLFINLAPAVVFSRPVTNIADLIFITLPKLVESANVLEVLPQSSLLQNIGNIYCNNTLVNMCNVLIASLANPHNIAPNVLPESLSYFPAGASYYILKHFAQLSYANRKLMKFNWNAVGLRCTSLVCNNSPQEYNLTLVTVPTVFFYGSTDFLVNNNDVKYFKKQLKNIIYSKKIVEFNHLDFILHKNVKSIVYDRIIKIISEKLLILRDRLVN